MSCFCLLSKILIILTYPLFSPTENYPLVPKDHRNSMEAVFQRQSIKCYRNYFSKLIPNTIFSHIHIVCETFALDFSLKMFIVVSAICRSKQAILNFISIVHHKKYFLFEIMLESIVSEPFVSKITITLVS